MSNFILNEIFSVDNESLIEITNFNSEELTFEYFLKKDFKDKIKVKIIDNTNGFILYQEVLSLCLNTKFWTSFKFCKGFITDSVSIIFESNGKILLNKKFIVYEEKNINIFSNLSFDKDVESYSYAEIFYYKNYRKYGLDVNENDVVVDIGSNQGAFIKYALDKKSSVIYSCDPNPVCISLIKKYYGNNKNLFLNEFAISDKCGESVLYLGEDSETSGCAKISEAQANINFDYENGKKVKIKSITFQEFIKLNKINHIDFLKIDCEGGEVFVFVEENKYFIKNNVDKIVLEFHNEKHVNIINYLKDLNYEVNIDYSSENLGMIFAKNKNLEIQNTKLNLKIGVLFASYNCADHIDRCFQPWLNLREELNLVLASTNGRYDLSDLKFDYKGNDSLIKLLGKNLDFLVHSTSVNHRWSEEQSRTYMLNYMLDRKVDLIFVIDADEFYTEEQIRNILKYIQENPNYDAYNVQFKNYVIKLPYWIEGFNKSVIYWCDRHSGIKCFNFDCEIAYNDGTIIQKNTNVNIIPKNIAFVEHYSWLENDPRTKEKTVLQNVKYFGEENLKCSFCYDENNNLIVNENFYRKRIGLLPTFHKTITKHCCDFDIYVNENNNSFHIKNVLVNKSFIFSIYNGETNDLIYAPLMNLSANVNYYINCGINLKDYKSFKIIVIDVETNKEIHDEFLFLKI